MLKLISLALFIITSGLMVWYLIKSDRGPKEPKGALLAAFGFGVLGIVGAAWAEFLLPGPTSQTTGGGLFLACLGVGAIEETAKFGPLALFIRNKGYFNEHTDGIIYFALSGLTFGFIENMLYLFVYSNRIGGSGWTGIFRLIFLFFFHAASTGIVGYYFAKAKIHRQSVVKPLIALVTLACVHGLYDFLFFYGSLVYRNASVNGATDSTAAVIVMSVVGGLVVSALLNTFLFLYYRRARQWDVSIGLASDPAIANQAPTLYTQA